MGDSRKFRDRSDGGRQLAAELGEYRDSDTAIVLGMARGGVPVAAELAAKLRLPLDVFVVRKLGLPDRPELAMGAVANGGVLVLNDDVLASVGIDDEAIDEVIALESAEVLRRERAYRHGLPGLEVAGRDVIIADDGLATGASMLAAVRALRDQGPHSLVVAVPVAAADTCKVIGHEVEKIVCLRQPRPFRAVGAWYEQFDQVDDDEVRRLLVPQPR